MAAQRRRQVEQRAVGALWGLIKNQRARLASQRAKQRQPSAFRARWKADKQEALAAQPRANQRRQRGTGSGHYFHRDGGLACCGHQALPWVRNPR
jgi:hypothetical protein